jgi:protocatechuate 3,4-dioxygenase beta subunit
MKCMTAAALLVAASAVAQDVEWVRQWEQIQRGRPAAIGSVARIAPVNEPGTPLVIHGRVFKEDGVTPAPGVVVFAYHTDTTGVYNRNGARGYRLHRWAKTDKEGRFEFQTIRPGSYPRSRIPAHVHLTIDGPGLPRRWTDELRFENDPFITEAQRRASAAAGKFGAIRPVTVRNGVHHVDFNLRIEESARF